MKESKIYCIVDDCYHNISRQRNIFSLDPELKLISKKDCQNDIIFGILELTVSLERGVSLKMMEY
jgi:hypothetical protein